MAEHDVLADSNESYTYDDNANRTGIGYATVENNRMTSDGSYCYTYDDEGNRIARYQGTVLVQAFPCRKNERKLNSQREGETRRRIKR